MSLGGKFSKMSVAGSPGSDLLRFFDSQRPQNAVLRKVVMHCPASEICCHCPNKEEHDDDECNEFSTESIDSGSQVPNTVYSPYITKHVAEADHDETTRAYLCFCRSTICDIVRVEVTAGSTALEMLVRVHLVAPELSGALVHVTDPVKVSVEVEDDLLFDDFDFFGEVTIEEQKWRVAPFSKHESRTISNHIQKYAFEVQHNTAHIHGGADYKHLTCHLCLPQEEVFVNRMVRGGLRQWRDAEFRHKSKILHQHHATVLQGRLSGEADEKKRGESYRLYHQDLVAATKDLDQKYTYLSGDLELRQNTEVTAILRKQVLEKMAQVQAAREAQRLVIQQRQQEMNKPGTAMAE